MTPEQINSEPVDPRTDLYGLGCALYAMLTGGPPFLGDNPLPVAHQHLTRPPPPVRMRRPDVPPALAALVDDLLARASSDRPADAAAVKARLVAALDAGASEQVRTTDLPLAAVPHALPG
jgi:serine/threonine-protein kinase